MTTPHDRAPLPRIRPRKGFNWLPMEQQLGVFVLVGTLLLALLPLLIDSGRAGRGQLKPALVKPRSAATALMRLERHVGFAWWTAGSAGEQRLRQKLLMICGGTALLGAFAGWKGQPFATTTTTTTTAPRAYGQTGAIRARSATTFEGDHV